LIVEDDSSMRENIAMFLEQAGYRVTQAASGEAALELLLAGGGQGREYDVVVTDLIMGTVDGIQVMEAARKQRYPPEVILLTGHGSLDTAIAAIRTQAFDYLLKPCRITRLIEQVEAAAIHHDEQQRKDMQAEHGRRFAELASKLAVSTLQLAVAPAGQQQEEGKTREESRQEEEQAHGNWVAEGSLAPANTTTHAPTHPIARHASPTSGRYLDVGELHIDTHRYEVWFRQQRVETTPTEYAILACLATTPGRVCTFAEITCHTHGRALERSDAQQLLGAHIRNLRKKLARQYLVSVRGVGYMLVDPSEEPASYE
jgi:DNA-binding response OmpR family regulator